ncbi:hypothetical protein [Croceicoccus sp. Ery15]|uniref:hypothetical protein n=1 Tax=Croceicoccus sp. Ery15 TaxID=1703338 RepID=UPI001E4B41D7|nr:hypothetical protein [Croceicoccus sp. Ery15]
MHHVFAATEVFPVTIRFSNGATLTCKVPEDDRDRILVMASKKLEDRRQFIVVETVESLIAINTHGIGSVSCARDGEVPTMVSPEHAPMCHLLMTSGQSVELDIIQDVITEENIDECGDLEYLLQMLEESPDFEDAINIKGAVNDHALTADQIMTLSFARDLVNKVVIND